jgi:hypothetical protein
MSNTDNEYGESENIPGSGSATGQTIFGCPIGFAFIAIG